MSAISARATMRAGVKVRVVGACMACSSRGRVDVSTLGARRRARRRRQAGFDAPYRPTIAASYSGRRRRAGAVEYVQPVSRLRSLARRYGFDALIVLAAVESALEVALRTTRRRAAHDALVRRSGDRALSSAAARAPPLPFAAPASSGSLGAALSFVDGRLVVFTASALRRRLAAAFLLGNLSDGVQARLGLGDRCSAARRSSSTTTRPTPPAISSSSPVLFAIAWLAGFALRERAEQAEAAEARAAQAERERETAARIAVAEERARIARELHDIVAHAVSVMVLQVGAVRHKLPAELGDESDALRGRRADRPRRARRDAPPARRDAPRRRRARARAPARPRQRSTRCSRRSRRAGLPVRLHVDGEPVPLPQAIDLSAYRIVQEGLTNALKHARASQADVTVRYAARRAADRGARRRRRRRRRATASATAWSACASASRSTAAR